MTLKEEKRENASANSQFTAKALVEESNKSKSKLDAQVPLQKQEIPTAKVEEAKPLHIFIPGDKKESLAHWIQHHIKFAVCFIILLLLAAAAARVYVSIVGDCSDLDRELDRLQSVRESLTEEVTGLEEQNSLLEEQIWTLSNSNLQFAAQVKEQQERNEALGEEVGLLQLLGQNASDLLDQNDLTLEQVQNFLVVVIANQKERLRTLEQNINSTSETFSNNLATFRSLQEDLEEDKTLLRNAISLGQFNAESRRLSMFSSLVEDIARIDGVERQQSSFNVAEIELLFERLKDIYFVESYHEEHLSDIVLSTMLLIVPGATPEEVREKHTILLGLSKEMCPQLYFEQ